MRLLLIIAAILAVLGLAHRFGRGPERVAAGILITAFMLTLANVFLRGPFRFATVDPLIAAIDVGAFFGILWVALYANRLWPLVVASLQMLVLIAHLSVLVSSGWNQAYWGMMVLAQYLQLVVTALGTINHYYRERRVGPYRSWRPGVKRLTDTINLKALLRWQEPGHSLRTAHRH